MLKRYDFTGVHGRGGVFSAKAIETPDGEFIRYKDYITEQVGNVAKPNACAQLYDAEATREKLASYAHNQWSGWMEYLFSKCEIPIHHTQAGLIIPPWAVERWKRQIETPYEELSEPEKESDRKEADGMLEIIFRSFI
jgi:hypothetical protein